MDPDTSRARRLVRGAVALHFSAGEQSKGVRALPAERFDPRICQQMLDSSPERDSIRKLIDGCRSVKPCPYDLWEVLHDAGELAPPGSSSAMHSSFASGPSGAPRRAPLASRPRRARRTRRVVPGTEPVLAGDARQFVVEAARLAAGGAQRDPVAAEE